MSWTYDIQEGYEAWEKAENQAALLAAVEGADAAHVFFHPALISAWLETYRPLRKLLPLLVQGISPDGLHVFWPLVLWQRNWKNACLRSIVPIGFSDFDYHDPIGLPAVPEKQKEGFYTGLLAELRRRYRFDELELDGLHAASLPPWGSRHGEEPCPYIDLRPFHSTEDYLQSRNKKFRYNLRRQTRLIAEAGELSWKRYTAQDIPQLLQELPQMLEYHRQRWPHAYKAPKFHANLLRRGLEAGIIHLSRADLNGKPASWRLGFVFRGRYSSYMPIMVPEFSRLAIGKQHLLHCIGFAIEAGLETYDQLRGAEMYKSEWTAEQELICSCHLNTGGASARLKQALLGLKNRLRR